jgi:penicillin-binding protein 1B
MNNQKYLNQKFQLNKNIKLALGFCCLAIVFIILVFGHFFFEYRTLTAHSRVAANPETPPAIPSARTILLQPPSQVVQEDLLLFASLTQEVQEAHQWLKEQLGQTLKINQSWQYIAQGPLKGRESIQVFGSTLDSASQKPISHKFKRTSTVLQVLAPIELTVQMQNICPDPYCFQVRTPFFELSPYLIRGLIGIEDERYLDHSGVDPWALLRALWVDLKAWKMVQGGSTITQQIVKNLYLGLEKTFLRKVREIFYSFYFEWEYSKEEILELYFNEVYWGSLGGVKLKGIVAAAHFYFQKTQQVLNPYEASILVSMLKGPTHYGLRRPWALRSRANLVFGKLKEMNLISAEDQPWSDLQWQQWLERMEQWQQGPRPKALAETLRRQRPSILNPYAEYVMTLGSLLWLERLNSKTSVQERGKELSFKTVIDSLPCRLRDRFVLKAGSAQQQATEATSCPEAFGQYSKWERSLSKALTDEAHQVGSLLKPLIYRGFMQQGTEGTTSDLNESVETAPITLQLTSGPWTPRESSREPLPETITLKEALQGSRNVPIIRRAQQSGFAGLEQFLTPYLPELKKPLAEFPAQLLGSLELPLSRLTAVYEQLLYSECKDLITQKVTNEQSVLVALSNPHLTTLAPAVRGPLADVAFFAKTGTSNFGNDNWLAAFDGELLSILWVGSEQKEQTNSLELSGAWSAFKIYEYFQSFKGAPLRALDCEALRSAVEEEQTLQQPDAEQSTTGAGPASASGGDNFSPAPLIIPQDVIYKDQDDPL